MNRHFDEQLQELLQRVVLMGRVAESMIQLAVGGLMSRNEAGCTDVFVKEQQVNEFHVEIDDRAVKLTALRQPVASDARFLFMASKIGSELERIADQAVNICQNAHYVLESPQTRMLVDLPIMADIAQQMVRDSLTAMINRDVALAITVLEEENKVDAFRDRIFQTLLKEISAENGTAQRDLSLILIARNVERIGDHATNIAEEVIYWIQGRDVRHGHAMAAKGADSSIKPPGV
ncbi:MAG: phosphate signaling complex protein PhoU [Anaerolineae bacterium]|nr:phosphate signaling complex protein PhoU [Phycisphaerae bacterium]